jgi:hypothetical protein
VVVMIKIYFLGLVCFAWALCLASPIIMTIYHSSLVQLASTRMFYLKTAMAFGLPTFCTTSNCNPSLPLSSLDFDEEK